MKALVLGVNGMAGHMIAGWLLERSWDIIGFARKDCGIFPTIVGDAGDYASIAELIATGRYPVVINAIGVLNKAVDNDFKRSKYLNAELPHKLAASCQQAGCRLIHISTDCVFSGSKGSYVETDIPDAESLYGKTKQQGEIIDASNLTIRTSIVGPELKQNGIGLYHWFMQQTESVNGYKRVLWSGVTTLELAKFIEVAATSKITGIWHLSNNAAITKYDLLGLFNRYARKNKITIHPVNNPTCDKSLRCTRNDFYYHVPSYEEMVKDMGEWMYRHSKWYRQYQI